MWPRLLLVLLLAPCARAAPLIYAAGPSTVNGNDVNAEARFTFDVTRHTITIQLINLQLNPTSVGQLISGIEFDVTNLSPGILNGAVDSVTASSFDISGSGAPTVHQQLNSWIVQKIGPGSLSLCEICKFGGGGGPDELIMGGPDPATGASQTYSGAGGSIAGNGPHNPFIHGQRRCLQFRTLERLDPYDSYLGAQRASHYRPNGSQSGALLLWHRVWRHRDRGPNSRGRTTHPHRQWSGFDRLCTRVAQVTKTMIKDIS